MTCCGSEAPAPLNPRDFFGWRVCACCLRVDSSDALTSDAPLQNTRWPRAHMAGRAVALMYIVTLHVYFTIVSVDENGVIQYWRRYFLYATNWAFFTTLLYFVLINSLPLVVPRALRPWHHRKGHNNDTVVEKVQESGVRVRVLPVLLRACRALLHLAVVFQLVITCMFWGTLPLSPAAQKDLQNEPLRNAQTHGAVCMIICLEFFLTTVPVLAQNVVLICVTCVLYLTVNAVYTLNTGTAIYDFLTWTDVTSVIVVVGAIACMAIFAGLVLACGRATRVSTAREHTVTTQGADIMNTTSSV